MSELFGPRRLWLLGVAALVHLVATANAQSKSEDKIQALPGLTFEYKSNQYSGFLKVPSKNTLHYWFLESQGSPQKDPLVLWLNGGPGCSSLVGMFTELGPFYPNPDGKTLFENVYSWNKLANIVFLESPRNVGFSYGPTDLYNDELTTQDNADALIEFFKRYPEYKGRDFYVTGESYGGVYIPRLLEKLVDIITADPSKIPVKLVGAAIGNGILSEDHQTNSYVNLAFYRGITDYEDTVYLRDKCCGASEAYEYCNFAQYIEFAPNQTVIPKPNPDPELYQCGVLIKKIVIDQLYKTPGYNKYSHIQECYARYEQYNENALKASPKPTFLQIVAKQQFAYNISEEPIVSDGVRRFIDQAEQRNLLSSDQLGGFPCFNNHIIVDYMNQADLRKAIHVDNIPELKGLKWTECSGYIDDNYQRQTRDTMPIFRSIIDKTSKMTPPMKLRILIYNGDADGVCNFLGDEWFAEELSQDQNLATETERTQWFYQQSPEFLPAPVGFYKTYGSGNFLVDLVTVSGAGHYVPTYRPQPAFQMFGNFLAGERNYSYTVDIDTKPKDLKNDYLQAVPDEFTRAAADQVFYLPGVTFEIGLDFAQHSGYLKAEDGHYLHYWLIKSQNNAESDPLILWLNGGPGCSSLGGLLTELGPFRPNPDGVTLSENVYAWNRAANLLFLESPRGVGFSYQDTKIDNNTDYSDDLTIEDSYLALKDFFSIYPDYKRNSFYVTGESYGGVYVPTLTRRLIKGIQSNHLPGVNLVGMAVGNGELSAIEQIRSSGPLMYHRGILGKNEFDGMLHCCGGDYNELAFCDVTQFVYLSEAGDAKPINESNACDQIFAGIVQKFWGYALLSNPYNMYQDCYQQKEFVFGSRQMRRHKEKIRQSLLNNPEIHMQAAQQTVNTIMNVYSTDNQGGFPCFASSAATKWLNTPDVRRALHIPDYVQPWEDCNDQINEDYVQQFNDTSEVFDDIIKSGYPLRMLIYNGDTDLACNFIGDQWFIEKLAARHNLRTSQAHKNWNVRGTIAGYVKQFANQNVTIDLATVKGAGHLVPTDRPEASLQMITNFISKRNFNQSIIFSTKPRELLKQYQIEEKYSEAVGPISPVDLVANAHPQLTASRKYNALHKNTWKESEQAKQPQQTMIPPIVVNSKDENEINSLPNLQFNATKQWSGYLNPNSSVFMHYWLVEAQTDPDTAPLILWLNGGPGCSSLGGLFTENGPFRPTDDPIPKLVENLFSWNRIANVLYLESPRGVGFSYSVDPADPSRVYNDTQTALDNLETLKQFLVTFPEYENRDFYITGESYGGVYVPTLVDLILKDKVQGNLANLNLRGFVVGNGILDEFMQINSAIHLQYYRGFYDLETYQDLLSCCEPNPYYEGEGELMPCDFTPYLNIDDQGDSHPLHDPKNATFNHCAGLINEWGYNMVWNSLNSVYNTYQDCYEGSPQQQQQTPANYHETKNRRYRRAVDSPDVPPLMNNYTFIDQAKLINKRSSDALRGFQCYSGEATHRYLNDPAVKAAINVDGFPGGEWTNCSMDMNSKYVQENHNTADVFKSIISNSKELIRRKILDNFKVLIYNGDADMACEFLGDEWFINHLMNSLGIVGRDERLPWVYAQPYNETDQYLARIAGYAKHFLSEKLSIDLLTVKGAGHFVPTDRPGPTLQMIKNFIEHDPIEGNLTNYNLSLKFEYFTPQELLQPEKPRDKPSRQQMDEVTNLPGLTFQPTFKQYSGYLKGKVTGNYLHYWLVEAQNDPDNAPLVLWLNGGPGCSSMGGLLGENGPFLVNPDGRTLFENVFSWNKAANILYIESPRGVGFSYQNMNENDDMTANDDLSADDVTWALADFFSVHTNYKDRAFYLSGESYAGVYVPTTTRTIINELAKPDGVFEGLGMNLRGFLIGNAFISSSWDAKTMLDFYYFHGLLGKKRYDDLRECCKKPTTDICDLTDAFADENHPCFSFINDTFDSINIDSYNIYQQCYQSTVRSMGSLSEKYHDQFKEDLLQMGHSFRQAIKHRFTGQVAQSAFHTHQGKMNYVSTDPNGGFMCYMAGRLEEYLNQRHVRDVLHIPEYVQNFSFCWDHSVHHYKVQYREMDGIFAEIINSEYVANLPEPFQILLHNGDSDLVCDFMETEYFVEALKTRLGGQVEQARTEWRVYLPDGRTGEDAAVAGWHKKFGFSSGKVRFDVVTVKGSGHFVPSDRALPALQLFSNFVNKISTPDSPIEISLARQPLKSQYEPLPTHPAQPHIEDETTTQQATDGTPNTDQTNPPSEAPEATTKFSSSVGPKLFILVVMFVASRVF